MRDLPLSLKAVVASRAEVAELLQRPGDAVLIQRGQPRWLLLKCPCGCGDDIPVNLDSRAGAAWRFYRVAKSGVSLFPSVWRDTGCESHFVVWRDRILLFGGRDDDVSASPELPNVRSLAERALATWPCEGFVAYADVAETLDEVPWDVLDACRLLVREKALIEGRGLHRGMFRRL